MSEDEDCNCDSCQPFRHTPMVDDLVNAELLRKRIVIFYGELLNRTTTSTTRYLEYLALTSKEPIKIILNSVGGDLYNGLMVYNTIRSIITRGIPVVIEARGLAASMGCIILQSGTKRVASKQTRFLIHEVSSIAWGKTSEVEEQAVELAKVNNMCKEILAKRCGKTPEEIEKIWHKTDVWFSAEEARQFGLIDEIVNDDVPTTN